MRLLQFNNRVALSPCNRRAYVGATSLTWLLQPSVYIKQGYARPNFWKLFNVKIKKKQVKRDLFMCVTPLQILIARRIIESQSYDGEKPDLVLVALSRSDKYTHYFEKVSPYCRRCIKIQKLMFPFNLYYIARYFFNKNYNRLYLASIDASFFQLLISFVNFLEIRTFDDGTANITGSSAYYHDPKGLIFNAKRMAFWLAGNRYSRKRIINESKEHYTIYPGFKNICENTKCVELISDVNVETGRKQRSITIVLGTCYGQAAKSPGLEDKLIKELESYVKSIDGDKVYYIPHPRDERNIFREIEQINDQRISEEIISDFVRDGDQVTLIGFASSVQFSFLNNNKVENISLTSPYLKDIFNDLSDKLSEHGGKVLKI